MHPKTLLLIGGFLGAGKTTAIRCLSEWLSLKGLQYGIITNDQGENLIDTDFSKTHHHSVKEVAGGCFCCKAKNLGDSLEELRLATDPDVFIAEPVGSCTDLVATVLMPLAEFAGANLKPGPLSVVVDASRLADYTRHLESFSEDIHYIYDKQIEEATYIVVNKIDSITPVQKKALLKVLREKYPDKRIFPVSCKTKEGLLEWFEALMLEKFTFTTLDDIDYEKYASGEARLGWLNARIGVHSRNNALQPNQLLLRLAQSTQIELKNSFCKIAHCKFSLRYYREPENLGINISNVHKEICIVNIVRNDAPSQVSMANPRPFFAAELNINLRAEGRPELLKEIIHLVISKQYKKWHAIWKTFAAFTPGKPIPSYRYKPCQNQVISKK